MDYESIREQASGEGRRVNELLALAPGSDPFYAQTPGRVRAGEWFADVWRLLGQPSGAHLRRLHYQLISQQTPPSLPDGAPYENTDTCWVFLNTASRNARYLKLVDPTAFEDHRSPQPYLNAVSRPAPSPAWSVDDLEYEDPQSLPRLDASMLDWEVNLSMPSPSASGYDYHQADQPYHLEVWIEKSTMTDVLLPICETYGVNLVIGVGYLSITRVVEMLQRVAEHGKPTRIFYISDFDPSGEGMPIQVARQSEFWLLEFVPDADLKIEPLALTAEQVRRYNLPRTPIKADHKQKDDFEARHGGGAVELDALEALQPGELADMVQQAISPYIDRDLLRSLVRAGAAAQTAVTVAWNAATKEERAEIEAISEEAAEILLPFQEEADALASRIDLALAPLAARLEHVWQAIRSKSMDLKVQLPDRPESELEPPDSEEDWLFDAARDYGDQIAYYKDRRPGKQSVKPSRAVTCEVCGRPAVVRRKDSTTCSRACQIKRNNDRQTAKHALPPKPCEVCATVFVPQKANGRYCSVPCNTIAQRRIKAERKKATRQPA
jgi:hypothetical protein